MTAPVFSQVWPDYFVDEATSIDIVEFSVQFNQIGLTTSTFLTSPNSPPKKMTLSNSLGALVLNSQFMRRRDIRQGVQSFTQTTMMRT